MQISVKRIDPTRQRSECLIVAIHEGRKLSPAAEALDKAGKGQLRKLIKNSGMEGQLDQTLMLYGIPGVEARRVLLVGAGKKGQCDGKTLRRISAAAVRACEEHGVKDASSMLTELQGKTLDGFWAIRHAVEASEAAAYRFESCKSEKSRRTRMSRLTLAQPEGLPPRKAGEALKQGRAVSAGVSLARDLGNLPGNICTPAYLARQARELGRKYPKLKVTVIDEAQMKKLGMGALLAVSRGSRQPAKLIIMEYKGGKAGDRPHVLVGKGLTFDAGGISLKPPPAMDEMKFDMCGGASVFGAMRAVCELAPAKNIIGVVPSSENLPDGDANKPGDILTTMSGQTVEVLNTDAEGRLILCDALTYTERFKPASVVDIATLTGACVIALGSHASGLFSQDDKLAEALLAAGETTTDRAWRMPLWDDYHEQLKTNFADVANVGGREAGSITAACFLSRFTKKYRWAHLDVAGSAWHSGAAKGATGRPVSLLVQYLLDRK